ncbi:hypothetical protein ACEWY4_018242 [Coilia grayii]|uniref:Myb/SANT-like DNA-binding domain-containing protein n=1 Tax=Coilia grayii TaxID=363190 RepID=A0ABD1JMK2_9TELE
MAAQRQRKKPHFTAHKVSALVTEVFDRRSVLFSQFKTSVTNADKKTAWAVTGRVNAVGQGYTRTVEEVRIKWRDFSSATKKKAAARRREREQTGGGSTTMATLTPEEERVLAVLGPEAVEGIPGGHRCVRFTQISTICPPAAKCPGLNICSLLHNMALRANVQLPDDEGLQDEEAEDNLPDIQDLHPAGQQVRQGLVDNLFGP